uniref:4F5 domain-containing protein n=1 Tax=Elaeophora elaphi TaxID=1147741 RepID=A0A0R3RHZ9_9BILA
MSQNGERCKERGSFKWQTYSNLSSGVKLDNRMERDADIMRKKQEAAAAKKAAEEAAARAEKNKKLQVFDPLK